MANNRIVELANIISANTKAVDDHLTAQGLPTPSFDADSPQGLLFGHGEKVDAVRQAVVDATDELQALMLGPGGLLSSLFHNPLLSIHFILRFNILDLFDGKDEISYSELASKTGQYESEIRRILRLATAFRIFTEPRNGYVAHTAASKRLATDPLARAWLGFVTEELWPAAVKTVDTLQKYPDAQEPNQTAWNSAHEAKGMLFSEIAKDPVRESRYANAMGWAQAGGGFDPTALVETVPWGDYDTIVDVGGNTGLIGKAIAQRYPSVKVIVQDRPEPVAEGRQNLPPELTSRVSFMEHDFFDEQPVRADVYLLRWILHDWSDKYGVKILRALVPSLKRGARIVINEFVMPPPGVVPSYTNKVLRVMDLSMLELHNGKERGAEEWKNLFECADSRFKFLGITRVPSSKLGIIEAKWEPFPSPRP